MSNLTLACTQYPKWIRARRGVFEPAIRALFLLSLGSAVAAEAVVAPANFIACASVADPTARLVCYDAAAGRTKTAATIPSSPTVAAATGPPQISATSPSVASFGDKGQLPSDTEAHRNTPTKIEAYVKGVASLPNSRYALTLDNGQVWQTTEANWAVEFKPDDAVTISRLALGGYQIALTGEHRSLGAKRTR